MSKGGESHRKMYLTTLSNHPKNSFWGPGIIFHHSPPKKIPHNISTFAAKNAEIVSNTLYHMMSNAETALYPGKLPSRFLLLALSTINVVLSELLRHGTTGKTMVISF